MRGNVAEQSLHRCLNFHLSHPGFYFVLSSQLSVLAAGFELSAGGRERLSRKNFPSPLIALKPGTQAVRVTRDLTSNMG